MESLVIRNVVIIEPFTPRSSVLSPAQLGSVTGPKVIVCGICKLCQYSSSFLCGQAYLL